MHPDCTQFATVGETGAPILQPKCNRGNEMAGQRRVEKTQTAAKYR
jgi:hypothetical protein